MVTQGFTIYRAQHKAIDLAVSPAADITGWTITFSAARALGSSVKAIGPLAASVTNGALGQYRVSLTSAMTDIRPAEYAYDVWRVDTGLEELLARGTLTVADAVRLP